MGRRRRYSKSRADGFDWRLELMCGPGLMAWRPGSRAEHVELLREAWPRWREVILADARPGWRPWAFWEFELGEHPESGDDVEVLARLGVLGEEELQAIVDAGDRFLLRWPPPYSDVPQTVHDGNVAREALGMAEVQVEVRDVGGEG